MLLEKHVIHIFTGVDCVYLVYTYVSSLNTYTWGCGQRAAKNPRRIRQKHTDIGVSYASIKSLNRWNVALGHKVGGVPRIVI